MAAVSCLWLSAYGSAVCSLASECCVAVRKQKFSNMAESMDGSGQLLLHDSVSSWVVNKGWSSNDVIKEKIKKGKQNPNRYIYVHPSS